LVLEDDDEALPVQPYGEYGCGKSKLAYRRLPLIVQNGQHLLSMKSSQQDQDEACRSCIIVAQGNNA